VSEQGARLDLLTAALLAVAPTRLVTRSLRGLNEIEDRELDAGVFTIVSKGESDYANTPGREAQLGTGSLIIIGQLKVAENADGAELEEAEFLMVEELKALAQSNLAESIGGLTMLAYRQSAQLERPYGWLAADFELRR